MLLNADANPLAFTLAEHGAGRYWEEMGDTANGVTQPAPLPGGDQYEVQGRSMAVFRLAVLKRRRRTDREPRQQTNQPSEPTQVPEPRRPVAVTPGEEPEPVAVGEDRSHEPALAR